MTIKKKALAGALLALLAAGGYYWLARAAAPGSPSGAAGRDGAAQARDGQRGQGEHAIGAAAVGAAGAAADAGQGGGRAGRAGAGGPTLVRVAAAQRQDVAIESQANGTVVPLSSVEIRPHVSRLLRQVHVKEGQSVRAGALLFTLDDRAEKAVVEQAQAKLRRGEAALADLERQYKRSQELAAQKFISTSATDSLQTQVETARAQLQSDQAALRAAQVDLSHTVLRAPSSGRVGAINVYPGSTVQVNAALATVTRMDPIAVSFTVPESGLADLLAGQRDGGAAVSATLPDSARTLRGKLSFIDSAVDPVAGTIRVKAQFSNGDAQLWPGQFVQTRITLATLRGAVVVPQAAVVTGGNGARVYTLGKDQVAQAKTVQLLHAFGNQAAVAGLAAGEQIIVEGKQNLRPGGKVRVEGGKPQPGANLVAAAGAAR
ncbi:efflux RND transporter periplasmic adaptor subunit [Pseudoduganella namucuonensis]|uniref:RND family efflux transporter, MFP subunit n=1 Tax=Pseudoduganella namucuonensis TaxID=1035707 RepID=A0A1I7JD21_9BURK|nr:efflux RND transporter periplasmic adaptor subunit [Pseudoduganella namucuonensis]SFU83077.1 RND family efflux transporter, MFP subunit [Pseudoduganella namucuonensis]